MQSPLKSFLGLALIALCIPLHAGETVSRDKEVLLEKEDFPPVFSFVARGSYVFAGDFKDEGFGDQDAINSRVGLNSSFSIAGPIYFAADFFYERNDFGTSLAPVPTTLQEVGVSVGLDYRVGGQAVLGFRVSPGYYGSKLESNAFNAPIFLAGSYQLNKNFIILAGVRYNDWSEFPILPLAGFIWTINESVTLRALFPSPHVEFKVNPELSLKVGGELVSGTFKTAEDEQNFAGENLQYRDFRVGAGITYKPSEQVALEVKAGWSVQREFRYDDQDEEFEVEGAPYVGLSALVKF